MTRRPLRAPSLPRRRAPPLRSLVASAAVATATLAAPAGPGIVAATAAAATVAVAIACADALAPTIAHASQYNLEQARAIIPGPDARRLRKAGIRSTLDLLTHGRTAAGRATLAARAGYPVDKIAAWVSLADLMRVTGIGPDVARLLTAAGVRTLADLQRADPGRTGLAVHDVNKRSHLSTNPPTAASIAFWVTQAQRLPVVLE